MIRLNNNTCCVNVAAMTPVARDVVMIDVTWPRTREAMKMIGERSSCPWKADSIWPFKIAKFYLCCLNLCAGSLCLFFFVIWSQVGWPRGSLIVAVKIQVRSWPNILMWKCLSHGYHRPRNVRNLFVEPLFPGLGSEVNVRRSSHVFLFLRQAQQGFIEMNRF